MTREELVNSLIQQDAEEKTPQSTESTRLVDDIIRETKEETGFTRWAEYSAASSFMGLAQIAEDLGLGIDFDEDEALLYRDMAEIAGEDNLLASLAGQLVGGSVDLVGGGILGGLGRVTTALGKTGWNNLFTQGLAGGAIGGFLEPILTEEDSTAMNVAAGTAFGGVLGGAAYGIGRLLTPSIPTPTPTQPQGQLALPAPEAPVALLPSPQVATPRLPFQPGTEGKPATAGGVVPMTQETTGLAPMQGYPAGVPAAPGVTAPRGSATPIRPVEFNKQDSFDALGQVRADLMNLTDTGLEKADYRRAQVEVRNLSGQIEKLRQDIAKSKRGSQQQKKLQRDLKEAEAKLKDPNETINKWETGEQAKKELTRLDNGQVSPLILDRVANVAKKKPLARAVETTTPKEPRPSAKAAATREARTTGVSEPVAQVEEPTPARPFQRPEAEPTPPPNVRTTETDVGRRILERRKEDSSVGAMETNKATAGVDTEAAERVPFRSTQAKDAQGTVPGQGGRVFTDAELRRRKMYQNSEEIGRQHYFQPEDLLDMKYNFTNVQEAARVMQDDINQMITEGNYKDAGDWVIKTFNESRTKTLTPVEQLAASRILAIASDNLNKLMPMYRKLATQDALNSAEAVRMTDDLQVTKELMSLMRQLERIDEASRANISNALKNYKLANKYQQKHQRQLMEGKIITDLFFGVTCG